MTSIYHEHSSIFSLFPEDKISLGNVQYILKKVTRGGMGCVFLIHKDINYKNTETVYGPSLALKALIPGCMDKSSENLYKKELAIWAGFRHPNIVRLVDIADGKTDGWIAVMDWHRGSLRNILDIKNKLIFLDSSNILISIINGLNNAYLVDKVLHLDIKPENILYDNDIILNSGRGFTESENSCFMVADWGIHSGIKLIPNNYELNSGKNNFTLNNIGTISYMAPERFIPGYPSSITSDIFSLGIMYLEMIAGKLPYYQSTETADQIKTENYYRTAISLIDKCDISKQAKSIILAMIAPRIENRINNYSELTQEIFKVANKKNNMFNFFKS